MARLAKFLLSDGSSIVAEVDEDQSEPHRTMRGGDSPAAVIVKANETFEGALDKVRDAAEAMVSRLCSLTKPPDEMEVEFGVKLSAEAGAVIAKAATEANFTISLKWTKAPAAKE